jgi:hypothetical protein
MIRCMMCIGYRSIRNTLQITFMTSSDLRDLCVKPVRGEYAARLPAQRGNITNPGSEEREDHRTPEQASGEISCATDG